MTEYRREGLSGTVNTSANVIVPPVERTLIDQVVRQLRTQIILGRLRPGERLVEQQLTGQLQVSRSTVREALRCLAAEGLVERAPHRHSVVARLTLEDAAQICDLNALLESYAVEHLKLPIPAALSARLKQLAHAMRGLRLPEEIDRFIELDHRFHQAIVAAAEQHQTLDVWNALSSRIGVLLAFVLEYMDVTPELVAERHEAISEALAQPDPAVAARMIREHYVSMEQQIQQAAASRGTETSMGVER